MSDQPNKPFDPRVPQPETPPTAPAQPAAEPPTVFEGMTETPAPTPPPVEPPAAPTPPAYQTPPPAAPAPAAPIPPAYQAPTPPPAAPPAAPTPPAYQPPPAPDAPTPPAYSTPPPAAAPYVQPPVTAQVPAQSFAAPGASGPPTFDPPVSSPPESGGGRSRGPLIAVGVVVLAAIAGIAAFFVTSGDDGETDLTAPTTVPVATLPGQETTTTVAGGEGEETETSLPPAMSASVAELAESTVQIIMLSGDTPLCSGSGTIIDELGTILTNAHVIEPGGSCPYDRIGIAITSDAGQPPELLYLADVYAYDPVVDLAVVRISTDLTGTPVAGPFKAVPVGNSDEVQIGDQLRILGYPGIGGDTVTFTNGVVSGFAAQNGIGDRSWIKTDATIAGGNSGGAGFDDDGTLVGVPTQASAGQDGEIVDCRVITDTNGDGQLDGNDQCVPIGGFLNGLRPVNLAIPLIEQAAAGAPITIQDELPPPSAAVDTSEVFVFNPGWTLEASADEPFDPEFVRTATAGAEKLCIWFDWRRLPNGAVWDGVWQVDGVLNEGFSFFNEEWAAGDTGENYWLCAIENTGLASGLYEFIFYVEGEVIFYESFEITDTPRPLHEVTFVNNTDVQICYLYVAPFGAINTGLDELGITEFFEPGTSKTVVVPEGSIVADAYDCDFNRLYEQYDGQTIAGPVTVDITG